MWDVVAGHRGDTPLRLMGAVHTLVLEGKAPHLARFYPSASGDAQDGDPWPAFEEVLVAHREEVRSLMRRPCQTNEVGRCAALVGGFLLVARDTGLPLSLLEIGASAGLNLRWDHYRYECGGRGFGNPGSPVGFVDVFEEGCPPFDTPVRVAARAGCDLNPMDPSRPEDRLVLLSYLWADQVARFQRLRGALEVAARIPAALDRADALTWLLQRLGARAPGTATVVFHSIVEQQMKDEARRRLLAIVEEAGRDATVDAPLAWLRMEWVERPKVRVEVRLATWPGGRERLLALPAPHGSPVRWLGPTD